MRIAQPFLGLHQLLYIQLLGGTTRYGRSAINKSIGFSTQLD